MEIPESLMLDKVQYIQETCAANVVIKSGIHWSISQGMVWGR